MLTSRNSEDLPIRRLNRGTHRCGHHHTSFFQQKEARL
jgi:hypothetical protein